MAWKLIESIDPTSLIGGNTPKHWATYLGMESCNPYEDRTIKLNVYQDVENNLQIIAPDNIVTAVPYNTIKGLNKHDGSTTVLYKGSTLGVQLLNVDETKLIIANTLQSDTIEILTNVVVNTSITTVMRRNLAISTAKGVGVVCAGIPVLRGCINQPPKFNGISNQSYGDIFTSPNNISFTVTDVEKSPLTIVYKINNDVIKTEQSPGGATYSGVLEFTSIFDALPYGVYEYSVEASDGLGGVTKITHQFTKTKELIKPLPSDSSFGDIVAFNGEIKEELFYQCHKLYTNLTKNGVIVEESNKNKMSNLIDKVVGIALGKKSASGTVTSSSTTRNVQVVNGTATVPCSSITLPKLDFTPRLIVGIYEFSTANYYSLYYNLPNTFFTFGVQNVMNNGSLTNYAVKPSGYFEVSSSKIEIPFPNPSYVVNWIAYE